MSRKTASRKRPCRVCRKWFTPNPKVGERQKTCGSCDCKKEWHRRKSAEWNHKNRAYSKGNYLNKKLSATASDESEPDGRSASGPKIQQCTSVNVSLKSGLDPKDFEKILSIEQAIVIEYITDQIVRQALSKRKGPEQ